MIGGNAYFSTPTLSVGIYKLTTRSSVRIISMLEKVIEEVLLITGLYFQLIGMTTYYSIH